jgi:hypothetical protein
MKKLYTLLFLVVCSLSFGQTIYTENMGTGTGTLAITATPFQNATPIAYTGTADTRATSVSAGYSGASGERNVFITNTAGKYFQIDNINTSAYTSANIQMSFGYNTSSTSIAQLVIEQSVNSGTTWTPITFTPTATGWTLVTITGGQIPSSTTLSLRFSQPATPSGQFRIDDLKLSNVSASCTLALGATATACNASTLSLDTYSVTIPFTGAGNATYTITTAGTVSGDNPTTLASGNIVVTFTEGTAYAVNITGGTCNLDVNGNSPECKPVNALPYYEGFNYTAASSLGAQQTWTNVNSGDFILSTAGSLSYSGLTTSGNSVSYAADGIDCFSPMTTTNTGTMYYSFLLNVGSMTGVTNVDGGYIAGFGETTTALGATLWTKRVDDTNFNLGIEVRTAAAANTTYTTTTYATGQTYLVVVGYAFNATSTADDVVSLWVNPVVGATMPTATLTDAQLSTATDLLNISNFFLRQDSTTETPAVQIDELRIGTTWGDVVPQTAKVNQNDIAGLSIYPNPVSNGTLYINTDANDERNVAIFDVLGKQVLNVTTSASAINVANLNGGVYIVKVTENGKTATRKLVIK